MAFSKEDLYEREEDEFGDFYFQGADLMTSFKEQGKVEWKIMPNKGAMDVEQKLNYVPNLT